VKRFGKVPLVAMDANLEQDARDFSPEDRSFDARYPAAFRLASRRFWTPLLVARRVATLFARFGIGRVLDVGGGAGKFCLVAASTAPRIDFAAVEHRPYLVELAEALRTRLEIMNVTFSMGDVTAVSWDEFDGIYCFNPLLENLFPPEERFDDAVELSDTRFVRDGLAIEKSLRMARPGTHLITYHGASVRIPACYRLIHSEHAGSDVVRVWMKATADGGDGAHYVEGPEGVRLFRVRS
jgi:SAM-dependent methyltransferase